MDEKLKNEYYKKYVKMISKVAFSLFVKTGYPYQELVCQGNLIFSESLTDYNPVASSFSSWLYKKLKHGLIQFIKKEYRHLQKGIADVSDYVDRKFAFDPGVKRNLFFQQELRKLSKEAKKVIYLIQCDKEKFDLKNNNRPQKMRRQLKTKMKEKGFTKYRIRLIFLEINNFLFRDFQF